MKKSKFKGFTLIELIVVIAIIGILTLVIVPNWMNSIHKSRVREQNGKARVIFNAAQSAAQDFMFKERIQKPAAGKGMGNGDFYLAWNCTTQTATGSRGNGGSVDAAVLQEFADAVNHIFSDCENTSYDIAVKNYIVQAVVCGSSETPSYMGSFPEKQTDRNTNDTLSGTIVVMSPPSP